jgi:hypothetical protein
LRRVNKKRRKIGEVRRKQEKKSNAHTSRGYTSSSFHFQSDVFIIDSREREKKEEEEEARTCMTPPVPSVILGI